MKFIFVIQFFYKTHQRQLIKKLNKYENTRKIFNSFKLKIINFKKAAKNKEKDNEELQKLII